MDPRKQKERLKFFLLVVFEAPGPFGHITSSQRTEPVSRPGWGYGEVGQICKGLGGHEGPGLPGGEGARRGKLVMVTFVFPSLPTLHSVFPGC